MYHITGLEKFKGFVSHIEPSGIFDEEIAALRGSILYRTSQDEIDVTEDVVGDIAGKATFMVRATEALSRVLANIVEEPNDRSIYVKLPEAADLEEVILYLQDLQRALAQAVINETIQGVVEVARWDSGSFWLQILLGTPAAVGLVAGLAWSAAVVRKKIFEGDIFREYVRGLKIKNESLEDLLAAQKEATKQLVDMEAQALLLKHFGKEDDPDRLERLKMSLKTLAELIRKGAEVHPALSAPETVKNLFPDFKSLDAIASQIKQLTSSSGE
jgi:hypothetical protein